MGHELEIAKDMENDVSSGQKNIVYRILSYVWRNTFLKVYRGYHKSREENYWKEHRWNLGKENPDKTFYVIRRRDCYCGLFSLFLTNLQHIDNALKEGYIPVVDMQNDFNIYLTADKVGKENAWEYYFKQPCGYTLKDINKSSNVIIGSGAVPPMFPYLQIDFLNGKTGELDYWRKLTEKYMILSDTAAERVEEEYRRLFTPDDRVLGVKCRGTDYASEKPRNHPIQPTPEQAIAKAEEIFREQHCTKVFLATEDITFYQIFSERFGDKLVVNKTEYATYHGGAAGKEEYEREGGAGQAGMDYLVTTMLLARCQCLCAGCVSGTVAALMLTKGYDYTYLFDLGIYT